MQIEPCKKLCTAVVMGKMELGIFKNKTKQKIHFSEVEMIGSSYKLHFKRKSDSSVIPLSEAEKHYVMHTKQGKGALGECLYNNYHSFYRNSGMSDIHEIP